MERLEAAMAKARAARSTTQADGATDGLGVPVGEPRPKPAEATERTVERTAEKTAERTAEKTAGRTTPVGDWSGLRQIDIPTALARRKRLNALLGPEFSAPYDILRSRVLRQMKEANWTRVAITSPNTRCGKSTISLNLALSLARYGQFKVILMDFDLRHPALADLIDQKMRPDLPALLQPGARFADHAVRFGANLAICTNRAPVRHSAELLQTQATADALDRIEAEWQPDVMIFDTPPMQGNDDNLGFFARTDCALIITAAGSSTIPQIDTCEQEVATLTNVLGTVLNKCRYPDKSRNDDTLYY